MASGQGLARGLWWMRDLGFRREHGPHTGLMAPQRPPEGRGDGFHEGAGEGAGR